MITHSAQAEHQRERETDARVIFGFWVYIMSDCILFASIFATYAVLHHNTFGGPGPQELFSLWFVLLETLVLLTSSFTYGLGMLAAHRGEKTQVLVFLAITFLLGVAFLGMEVFEFSTLIGEGNGWDKSAFLSSFFTLLGTHGFHVLVGLMWMGALAIQVIQRGITGVTFRKLTCLGLFWHFLDIVWIFIFTMVYLMGAL